MTRATPFFSPTYATRIRTPPPPAQGRERMEQKTLWFGRWEKLQVSGSAPSVRFGHSTVVVGDVLYVFGGSSFGEGEETVYHNDLFTLDCKYSCQGFVCAVLTAENRA